MCEGEVVMKNMLDGLGWDDSIADQEAAIARIINDPLFDYSRLLQPQIGGKSCWENCAKILCSLSDENLYPHMARLLEWLQDPNWPGADRISNRVRALPRDRIMPYITDAKVRAREDMDEQWLQSLAFTFDADEYAMPLMNSEERKEPFPNDFMALVSDTKGHVYYFTAAQRNVGLTDEDGNPVEYDRHADIVAYYKLNKDYCNYWVWNPFSEDLHLADRNNIEYDSAIIDATIEAMSHEDIRALCGDYQAVRSLCKSMIHIPWLTCSGENPSGCKVFDTRRVAMHAAKSTIGTTSWNAAWNAAWCAAWGAARIASRATSGIAAVHVVEEMIWAMAWTTNQCAILDSVKDAQLLALIHVCDGLPLDQKHKDHAQKRWYSWLAGYGVAHDINGELVCYKKS